MSSPLNNTRKILFVTQALDLNDPFLSAYHQWVAELAPHFERMEVICLKEGRHELPSNVHVYSLGKEKGRQSSFSYTLRFLKLAWSLRNKYDAVFVHMNQEYILIAGALWGLMKKPVYLWRNHYAGSFLTDIAVAFCKKIFCTSTHSYTAKFKKNVFMPVGVDTRRFFPDARVSRVPHSILFFGRIAESKRPGLVIEALIVLLKQGVDFTASFVGSPLPKDEHYLAALKQRVADAGLMNRITFSSGIPNEQAPDLYRAHEVFVNASPSGMFDKTIFEAAASGCVVLASSDDWRALAGERSFFSSSKLLADRLAHVFEESSPTKYNQLAATHSLKELCERLSRQIVH